MSKVFLIALPLRIRGFCKEDENGNQLIFLNKNLTYEVNRKTYWHELCHSEDFNGSDQDINALESARH